MKSIRIGKSNRLEIKYLNMFAQKAFMNLTYQQILPYFKTISQGVPQLMDGKMN